MSPLVKYSLRLVSSRPATTLLLLVSMGFVGAAVGAVSAIAAGLDRTFLGAGRDHVVLLLSPNAGSDAFSKIANDGVATLTVSPEVRRSSAETISNARTWVEDTFEEVRVRALDPKGFDFYDSLKLVDGRLPRAGESEYMIGATLARKYPHLGMGGTLQFIRRNFKCVGVFAAGTFFDSEVWTTRAALATDRGRPYDVSVIALDAGTAANALAVVDRLSRQRAVPVDALVEPAYYARQMTRTCRGYYQLLLLGLALTISGAAFALAAALAVFFNRRIPDMCILRALGYRRRRLAMLLFSETEILVIGGGLLGTAVAFAGLKNFVAHIAMGFVSLNFQVPMTPDLFGRIAGIMAVIGAIAAVIPVVWLSRLNVHDGLRD